MLLDGLENTDSTDIVSTGQIDSGSVDGLNDGLDLTVCEVDLFDKKIALRLVF